MDWSKRIMSLWLARRGVESRLGDLSGGSHPVLAEITLRIRDLSTTLGSMSEAKPSALRRPDASWPSARHPLRDHVRRPIGGHIQVRITGETHETDMNGEAEKWSRQA